MSNPSFWKNKILAKCNAIARLVRDKKEVTFAQVCLAIHIAPSTLYAYIPILLESFQDIVYEDRVFKLKGD